MTTSRFNSSIIFFYTHDLPATHHFYHGLLGLPMVVDQGTCRIYRMSGDGFIGFCTHRDPDLNLADAAIITMVAEDVDGWYARLNTRGVVFEKAPAHNERFGIYHCFFRDPNGYLLEIQRFDDPGWASGD